MSDATTNNGGASVVKAAEAEHEEEIVYKCKKVLRYILSNIDQDRRALKTAESNLTFTLNQYDRVSEMIKESPRDFIESDDYLRITRSGSLKELM